MRKNKDGKCYNRPIRVKRIQKTKMSLECDAYNIDEFQEQFDLRYNKQSRRIMLARSWRRTTSIIQCMHVWYSKLIYFTFRFLTAVFPWQIYEVNHYSSYVRLSLITILLQRIEIHFCVKSSKSSSWHKNTI